MSNHKPDQEQKMEDFRKMLEGAGVKPGKWKHVNGGTREADAEITEEQRHLWNQVRSILQEQVARDRKKVKRLVEMCNRLKNGGAIT